MRLLYRLNNRYDGNGQLRDPETIRSTAYKQVLGFQPLQTMWNGKIVDAIFRCGKKHSNYENSVVNMIGDLVLVIRKEYREAVTIIDRLDSGFFDEKILRECDKLGIGFICKGKMYKGVMEYVGVQPQSQWKNYGNRNQEWEYLEFGYRCESWKKFYRAIYNRISHEKDQRLPVRTNSSGRVRFCTTRQCNCDEYGSESKSVDL